MLLSEQAQLMRLPQDLHFDVRDDPTWAELEEFSLNLEVFNEERWPGHQPWRLLAVFVRDRENAMAGGIAGETYGGWLFVRYFWVAEALRGRGIGRGLIAEAEARALARGCHSAWLDTFSFQAPGFYRKLGYEIFGELDWSPEHKRIFLRKRLRPNTHSDSELV